MMPRTTRAVVVLSLATALLLPAPASGTNPEGRSASGTITRRLPDLVGLSYSPAVRVHLSAGGYSASRETAVGAIGRSAARGVVTVAVYVAAGALGAEQPTDTAVGNAFTIWSSSTTGSTRISARVESAEAVGPDGSVVLLSAARVSLDGKTDEGVIVAPTSRRAGTSGDLELRVDASRATAPGWYHGARLRLVLENL